jgi:hypothetical protein
MAGRHANECANLAVAFRPGSQRMDIFVTEEARPGSCAVLGKSGLDLETRGDGHPLTETTAIPSLREASTATRTTHG